MVMAEIQVLLDDVQWLLKLSIILISSLTVVSFTLKFAVDQCRGYQCILNAQDTIVQISFASN